MWVDKYGTGSGPGSPDGQPGWGGGSDRTQPAIQQFDWRGQYGRVMANKIQCETHGECEETFVCSHLVGESAGLGFNRDEPSKENPCPDAWCDDCELIRAAHNGWNEESAKLTKILLVCSECYERARIRNIRTTVTLGDESRRLTRH
jgi:hypothetical protein